ncbi:hypothetical protein BC829DRAFT_253160 [Chytridium lagenaria]|nr:hypothetical protein BC829DRAFT_253160 [Chytridium lagenaria]
MAPLVSQSTYSPAASSSSPASSSSSSSSPSSPKPNSSLYAAAILLLVASSSSIVSAQQCQNDPRFPECNSVNTDGVWRVPIPPTNSDWTRIFLSNQNSAYPIPSISPNPSSFLGSWRPGASLNGIPWGDPRSLNTELYACKQNAWAFTFDDGPSSFTPDLLDFLSSRSAKATFFVIGSSVINEAGGIETLRRAYREGHQIGYHTWTHRPSSTLTNDELVSEIVWTAVAIYRAIGRVPRYYRPPYGDIDDRVRNLLLAMGLRPVIWTVDPNDSGLTQNEDFVRNILNTFRQTIRDGLQSGTEWLPPGPPFPGFISLEHDIRSNQVEAARSAIPIVQEANFEMVQVVDCDTRDAGGAYLGNGEPLLELVRSIAPDVVEPILDPPVRRLRGPDLPAPPQPRTFLLPPLLRNPPSPHPHHPLQPRQPSSRSYFLRSQNLVSSPSQHQLLSESSPPSPYYPFSLSSLWCTLLVANALPLNSPNPSKTIPFSNPATPQVSPSRLHPHPAPSSSKTQTTPLSSFPTLIPSSMPPQHFHDPSKAWVALSPSNPPVPCAQPLFVMILSSAIL